MNIRFMPNQTIESEHLSKYRISRLYQYVVWLDATGQNWFAPELESYRDDLILQQTIRPSTVQARIAAVRSRYREILNHVNFKQLLLESLPADGSDTFIEACIAKIKYAANPDHSKMEYTRMTRQWNELTVEMVTALLNAPNLQSRRGLRDTVIIALILFTGIRETEMRLITAEDLQLSDEVGEVGMHIPKGKASTERFVPFYEVFPIKTILETWLRVAPIQSGPLFRGFYKGGDRMRETGITLQGIEDIFRFYPVERNGQIIHIKPFDLRRYHAQMLYGLDYELETIAHNMGVHTETVVDYVGSHFNDTRLIPQFDLGRL